MMLFLWGYGRAAIRVNVSWPALHEFCMRSLLHEEYIDFGVNFVVPVTCILF